MTTGYNIREGAAEITARVLRNPDNWPSVTEGSKILASRFARVQIARRGCAPYLRRYETRAAA
jgi:hypothetical protein